MISPNEVAQNYIGIAKSKVERKWYKTLILGVLAGAFIAFGAAVATFASTAATGMQANLIKGAVFPLGLILVVVCGAELFTGNCLLVSPLLSRHIKPSGMLKNWGIVYGGNLIGGAFIALLVVYSRVQSDAVAAVAVKVAADKCNMNFGYAFLRGILCNMLVCLAVWSAMASKSTAGKIAAVYLPVLTFVVCGFEHSVANAYYLTAGLLSGPAYSISASGLSFGNALLYSLLPSTLGNIVGGALIAIAFYATFASKKQDEQKIAE